MALPEVVAEPFQPLSRYRYAETLIIYGRVLLAAGAWLAVTLGPEDPFRHAALSVLITAYFLYSLVLVVGARQIWKLPGWLGPAAHAVDLTSFCLLVALSGGATSPYYPLFIFALVGAALRWKKGAVAWTGLVALSNYFAIGLYSYSIHDPRFDLDLFVVRLLELCVATLMLVFLRGHLQNMESGLRRLAEWSGSVPPESGVLVKASLRRAAEVLGVDKVALLWEDPEEPLSKLAIWDRGEFTQLRKSCPEAAGWIPAALRHQPFFWLRSGPNTRAYLETGHPQPWTGNQWGPGPVELSARRTAICIPLPSGSIRGHLVAIDPDQFGSDVLAGGRLVARMVASQVDQSALWKSLSQHAADQERIRLARDLHDGLAQSLAGIALHLEAASRSMETDPSWAGAEVGKVKELLEEEQRELRHFILQNRTLTSAAPELPAARIASILRRIEKNWGVSVEITADLALDQEIPGDLASALCAILQEALSNAARHSGATQVKVSIDRVGASLQMCVGDNGHGFPFEGSRDLKALLAGDEGPRAIRDRVSALEGELQVVSTRSGSTICVELPLRMETA